jgi:anthranilate phosphoribosyltransferase
LAQVLKRLGAVHVYVVYGLDGIDEISISEATQISELRDGEIKTYTIEPSALGISPSSTDELKVESPSESAQMIRDVLAGKKGPARDAVLVNAGAAFVVGSKAEDIKDAIPLAGESIDSGGAAKALENLVRISNERKA